MDFNIYFENRFLNLLLFDELSKLKIYILLALLISSSATVIDIKTGDQAAMKGVKVPLTPSELEKKDKI